MIRLDTWQQTTEFDPTNPGQRLIEQYTGLPGGYSTFYFNRVPNTAAALNGTLAGGSSLTKPLLVVVGLVAGFLAWRHFR